MSLLRALFARQPVVEFVERLVAMPSDGERVFAYSVQKSSTSGGHWGIQNLGVTLDPREALSVPGAAAYLIELYRLPDGSYIRGLPFQEITLGLTKPEPQA